MRSVVHRMSCSWLVVSINVGSNLIGFFLVQLLFRYAHPLEDWQRFAVLDRDANVALLSILVPASILVIVRLTAPISAAIRAIENEESIDTYTLEKAKTRVLNLPFLVAAMNLVAWIVPAVAFPVYFSMRMSTPLFHMGTFVIYNFTNAVMITLLAFVILEHACRRRIIPLLFPKGGLRDQAGSLGLSIRSRLLIMYGAICLLPMVQTALMINANRFHAMAGLDPTMVVRNLGVFSWILFGFTAGYGLWLALLIGRTLSDPAHDVMQTAEKIRAGDYEARAKVLTNDEMGYLGDRVNEMARGLKEREKIREVFDLFTSPEISREILSKGKLEGGEIRRATLLFSDLRGFTGMAERLPPETVLNSINSYFDEMSAAVVEHGGIILQYVGDEIEAVFGAPIDDPQHADKAVAAALAMRESLSKLNERRSREGEEPLSHGIGIHTGPVLAGIVGSRYKISYAMVGDTVNIASRIQELNKSMESDILISGETHKSLETPRRVSGPLTASVKGMTKSVEVFQLIS